MRLNPRVESIRCRVLLQRATELLLHFALLLAEPKYKGKGRRPYDYRIVLVLCILRVVLRKTYAWYETEMRTDKRLMEMLNIKYLPCKSTINDYVLKYFTLSFLLAFNKKLVDKWLKKPVDLLLDASGIRLVGRSIWFCIKTKTKIRRKDCDKIHVAVSLCSLLIANFRITNSRRNDSPFLRKLLQPFRILGLVLADKAYGGKKNTEFVVDKKKGAFFCPYKENAKPSGFNVWKKIFDLWNSLGVLCKGIYNQRSKIEAVFSALKKTWGDQLHGKKWYTRRREMAIRFIAYNVRIIVGIQIAREKQLPLWVRA